MLSLLQWVSSLSASETSAISRRQRKSVGPEIGQLDGGGPPRHENEPRIICRIYGQ
jgi:hypothetical protein